jgi:hypothetical protein
MKKSDKKPLIPASYIFSYWILAWAIIYIFVKYFYIFSNSKLPKQIQWFNPTLIVIVAIIWNVESVIGLVNKGKSFNIIFKYALMIVCIKLIPLILIWTWDINLYRDVGIAITVFLFYCVYLWLNNTDYNTVYNDLTESVENDENRTPFEHLYARILYSVDQIASRI